MTRTHTILKVRIRVEHAVELHRRKIDRRKSIERQVDEALAAYFRSA